MKDITINDPFYLQIQREINRIEKKADLYTFLFYLIKVIQILFAGTITVISGLNNGIDNNTKVILILGAVTTAVTAIETLFQVDAKKNTYKLVLFELRTIRAELVYKYIQAKPIDGKKQIEEKILEELFEKYRKANSYARDLIGTDNENSSSQTQTPVKNQNVTTQS
jgi:hypothetical protein